MSIAFRCGNCGNQLRADMKLAGKAGKCQHCGQVVVVPASAPGGTLSNPQQSDVRSKTSRASGIHRRRQSTVLAGDQAGAAPEPPTAATCPNCAAPLAERAVLCVACGYNLVTKKVMETVRSEEPDSNGTETSGGCQACGAPIATGRQYCSECEQAVALIGGSPCSFCNKSSFQNSVDLPLAYPKHVARYGKRCRVYDSLPGPPGPRGFSPGPAWLRALLLGEYWSYLRTSIHVDCCDDCKVSLGLTGVPPPKLSWTIAAVTGISVVIYVVNNLGGNSVRFGFREALLGGTIATLGIAAAVLLIAMSLVRAFRIMKLYRRAKTVPCVDSMLAQGWLIDINWRGGPKYKDKFL